MPPRSFGLRSASPLRRRPPSRVQRARFLLVCEGEVTERGYFEHLRQECRTVVLDVPEVHGVPLSLAREAVARKRQAALEARRLRDQSGMYDEVWCILDVDIHPNIPQAVNQAEANEIRLALSNPCFELWGLLHFQEQHSYLERADARARLQVHLPDYDKRLPCEQLALMYSQARDRAAALEREHVQGGRSARENPSSSVWRLVDAVHEAAEG